MTISELGRKLKGKYPEYAKLGDQEAGELLLRKYPQYGSYVSASLVKPPLFAERAVDRMQKETAYTQEVINHANAPYIAQKQVDDKIAELERAREAADSIHLNLITQNENATSLKTDLPTASLIRLEEERSRIQIQAAKQMVSIEVDKTRQLETVRLDGYRTELGHDLEFLLRRKLVTHQEVLAIKTSIHNLLEERDAIEQMKLSEPTKNRMLAEQDKVIEAFQENLNGQILRLRITAGDGSDSQTTDPASDSPTGD